MRKLAVLAMLAAFFAACTGAVEVEAEGAAMCSNPCACARERFAECGAPLGGPVPTPDVCPELLACVAECQLLAPCDVLRSFASTGIGPGTDLYQCHLDCGVVL